MSIFLIFILRSNIKLYLMKKYSNIKYYIATNACFVTFPTKIYSMLIVLFYFILVLNVL